MTQAVPRTKTGTAVRTAARALANIHRAGAIVLGVALGVFGWLGFKNQLGYFETTGTPVLGLNTNGLLSTVSFIVGAALIAAGVRGGPTASTVTAGIGGLFILSGLANLAVLNTKANLLAFSISNVFFSLVAGLVLLTLGLYGRVGGGLRHDNPYRQAREARSGVTPPATLDAAAMAQLGARSATEQLVAEGVATPEQIQAVDDDRRLRAEAEHDRAWAHARRTGQAPASTTDPRP